jgi:hypothetical protein
MAFMGFFRGNAEDWGDVPAALGMGVNDRGLLMGTWNGAIALRGLHTWEIVEHHDRGGREHDDRRYYTELYAILDPELLVGLRADARSTAGRAFDAIFGQKDLEIGHAELDRMFVIKAADEELARRVLREPVISLLLAAAPQHPKLWVSDRYVTIEYPEYERDLRRVGAALEAVGRIAAPLLELRRVELARWEPELRDSWSRVAEAWGLTFDPPRATMRGVVRDMELTARVDCTGSTCVSARLPFDLGCDLDLALQKGDGFLDRLSRGQDVKVGDQAFDDAFVIKGKPEAAVRAALNPIARAKLLSIRERASLLRVKEGALEVWTHWRALRPEHLDAMLKLSFEAVEALRPAGAGHGGPIRV